jgi:hypothetical protein
MKSLQIGLPFQESCDGLCLRSYLPRFIWDGTLVHRGVEVVFPLSLEMPVGEFDAT